LILRKVLELQDIDLNKTKRLPYRNKDLIAGIYVLFEY
jgi:hypothetical protein